MERGQEYSTEYDGRVYIDATYVWARSLAAHAEALATDAARAALESPMISERALACKRAAEAARRAAGEIERLQKKHGTYSGKAAPPLAETVAVTVEAMELLHDVRGNWDEASAHARRAAEMAGGMSA